MCGWLPASADGLPAAAAYFAPDDQVSLPVSGLFAAVGFAGAVC